MSIQAPAAAASLTQSADQKAFVEQLKRLYRADQQAEFLFIQAEADSLLVQLEQLKAQQTQGQQG